MAWNMEHCFAVSILILDANMEGHLQETGVVQPQLYGVNIDEPHSRLSLPCSPLRFRWLAQIFVDWKSQERNRGTTLGRDIAMEGVGIAIVPQQRMYSIYRGAWDVLMQLQSVEHGREFPVHPLMHNAHPFRNVRDDACKLLRAVYLERELVDRSRRGAEIYHLSIACNCYRHSQKSRILVLIAETDGHGATLELLDADRGTSDAGAGRDPSSLVDK